MHRMFSKPVNSLSITINYGTKSDTAAVTKDAITNISNQLDNNDAKNEIFDTSNIDKLYSNSNSSNKTDNQIFRKIKFKHFKQKFEQNIRVSTHIRSQSISNYSQNSNQNNKKLSKLEEKSILINAITKCTVLLSTALFGSFLVVFSNIGRSIISYHELIYFQRLLVIINCLKYIMFNITYEFYK